MDNHYIDKSIFQIKYPNPHHPLGVGTINRKDNVMDECLYIDDPLC
jgi:hypothetical protein